MKNLGKINSVEVRSVWKDEARQFTPWLASEEGIGLLSEQLGVELELLQVEGRLNSYKADIVAKIAEDEEDEKIVVIENQLTSTNHDHLGKIVTYAAGHNAIICVWVATSFSDDHRQAIDWLNENMTDIAFFALEIEVIKIGESEPAPRFKMISSPNEWKRAVKAIQRKELSDVKLDQLKFWQELKNYSEEQSGKHLNLTRKPQPQHWHEIAIGRSGFHISLTVNSVQERVGCEIYMHDKNAKKYFDKLFEKKEEVENELGYVLEWQRLDDKRASRIIVYRSGSIEDEDQRYELLDWLYQKANEFHKIFYKRIQDL